MFYFLKREQFYRAVRQGNVERVRELLDKAPKLGTIEAHWQLYPPWKESRKANAAIMDLILQNGGSATSYTAQDKLRMAANNDEREIVEVLLKHGANVNHKAPDTALHRAADWCYFETVRILLEHGADPNLTDQSGRTPLAIALRSDSKEPTADKEKTIELLRQHGATEDERSSQPAAVAAACRHHFLWITRSGGRCDVCGRAVSQDLVSEDRGKFCEKCGLIVHVNCQHQL